MKNWNFLSPSKDDLSRGQSRRPRTGTYSQGRNFSEIGKGLLGYRQQLGPGHTFNLDKLGTCEQAYCLVTHTFNGAPSQFTEGAITF